jgi:peroxiredoxin family protein
VGTGRGLFGRLLGLMYGGDIERAGPSRLRFGGLGRWMFKKMMRAKRVPSLGELRQTALDLGVKFYGCQMSMDVMEIPKEALIGDVSSCVGVAFFIEQAQQSEVSLFI